MLHIRTAYFIIILSFVVSYPFSTLGLTFTLSDDAIMALDFNEPYDGLTYSRNSDIIAINNVKGPGVQFDIHFSAPFSNYSKTAALYWVSSLFGGKGVLAGRDISMFDSFALKFTLLSFDGISLSSDARPIYVGPVISVGDTWGCNSEFIVINSPFYSPAKTLVTQTEGAGKISTVGFACYIPSWYYNRIYPSPWSPDGAVVSILVEPAEDAVVMTSDPCQSLQFLSVDKCKVTAGPKPGNDKISFSGNMNPSADDFNTADGIQIVIDSNDIKDPCVLWIPFDGNSHKKTGRYSYSGTDDNGIKQRLKLNLKTHKVYFSARKLSLSGLSCPLKIGTDMAGFSADAEVNEAIVNGPRKPIPIELLMGVKNSIRVDKITVRHNSNKNTDRLFVRGAFSVKNDNVNMVDSDFTIILADQEFVIPAKSFKTGKNGSSFKCGNVQLRNGADLNGIASANFNLKNCRFTLTLKDAFIEAGRNAMTDVVIKFADFNAESQVFLE